MTLPNVRWSAAERRRVLQGVKRIFFLGVGGVHMWALAMMARSRGYMVEGMDRTASVRTERLGAAGITVYPETDARALRAAEQADAVVYTLALSAENPLYLRAKERGIPLFSRAEFLGFLMESSPTRVCVAGCHGKSTTTAWLGETMVAAGRSPTVVCGADMPALSGSYILGEGDSFVAEACEYGDSFLSFSPTLAVVLNVGFDHADYFGNEAAVAASFSRFAAVAERVLVNGDDERAMAATATCDGKRYCFGLSSAADFRAERLLFKGGTGRFLLVLHGQPVGEVALRVPGMHNVYNALAVAGAAALCGLSNEEILQGLKRFCGVARRCEYKGRLCGARVFDDYAHHPDEIVATLQTAREMLNGTGRLVVAFQPHTYTRTAALWEAFCVALRMADRVLLADIYAAREMPIPGVDSKRLAVAVGEKATYHSNLSAMAAVLSRELGSDDLLLVMGAGDIDGIFGEFSRKDFTI